MMRFKVAVIVGSLRKDSINRKVARNICALSRNLDCAILEIGDLPLFNQDLEHRPPVQWQKFRDALRSADGILFVTPEHNWGVPGPLKNALDVGSGPSGWSALRRKPAAIICADSVGGMGVGHQLRQVCACLDMPVLDQPEAYLDQVGEHSFDSAGRLKEGPLKDLLHQLVEAFHAWIGVEVWAEEAA